MSIQDRCHNDHPRDGSGANRNSYAPLQSSSNDRLATGSNRVPVNNRDAPYKLDKTAITNDLSKERPQWILSAYGPGREAPLQLFGGLPREQSFEELRCRHYELTAQGNPQQAIHEAQSLVNNAEQQIQTALNDVEGGIKYIINGENEHPNRIDVVKARKVEPVQSTTPFSQSATVGSTFEQPSTLQAFGRPPAPAFGQPSVPVSTLGPPPSSSFGQPSALGQSSAWGRPSTSFGQATFGTSAPTTPAFGQSSTSSPFGAPQPKTTLFTPDSINNPFGQPSVSNQPGVFGQPAVAQGPNSTGPFAQPSVPNVNASTVTSNPFSEPARQASAGIFSQTPASMSQSSKSRISYANRPVPSFGFSLESIILPSKASNSATTANTKAANVVNTERTSSSNPPADKDTSVRITNWKGRAVSYLNDEPCFKNSDGQWQRIWFPHGPPPLTKSKELTQESYSTTIQDDYKFAKEHKIFQNGIMPEIPPRRAWCNWDF